MPGKLRRHSGGPSGNRHERASGRYFHQTGMRGSGTGQTDDDVSEDVFGISSDCRTDSDDERNHAQNTFEELFRLGIIPIVNENDTVSTYEMQFGDNDTLSALVASLVGADLLILLSDIDGLFTDDPRKNPNAEMIRVVDRLDEEIISMAKGTTGSDVGTGGMETKLTAARIATLSGADMIIANGKDVGVLHEIFQGEFVGTLFLEHQDEDFYIADFIEKSLE